MNDNTRALPPADRNSPQQDRASMKVGFFDSGVGGRCILEAFRKICPEAETLYVADTENCPYGNRPLRQVREFSERSADSLVAAGCGIIVIACNTATAASIDHLRRKYPHIEFVGIEPAVKTAAMATKTGVVAVLATAGTFDGALYRETRRRHALHVQVVERVADEFVTAVENLPQGGVAALDGRERAAVQQMVDIKIRPLLEMNADMIVLGCTHYSHLKELIAETCGGRAEIVDAAEAVAKRTKELYERKSAEFRQMR